MNISAWIGMGLTACLFVAGSMLNSGLDVLYDPTSLMFVVPAVPLFLLLSYSAQDIKTFGFGGLWRFLVPSAKPQWSPDKALKAARVANTAGVQAIYIGAAGTLIGTVQMLQGLDDPTAIGPALAVAVLTLLYGFLMSALIFMPTARHHEQLALKGGAEAQALDLFSPAQAGLVMLALVGMAVGITFLVMLLAMANRVF
jgi:flagellar motor component MotA